MSPRPALRAVIALALMLAPTAHVAAAATVVACKQQMAAVRTALEQRDDLRDEAYTAIMWARMDAEQALERGDAAACMQALDFPRRALGIHEQSTARR